jgi:hypothetical protein
MRSPSRVRGPVDMLVGRFAIRDRCYDFKNIFRQIFRRKKLALFTQNKAILCKILIITLVSEKNANFFAENCQKSQKIVIITPTPGIRRNNAVPVDFDP